ncbi:DEAD/DEAH box helicase [Nocardiopsis mangrovi]|uniref:DEAD/DEAH box helicase n=1 Tax=Nocardiopsis mangrovi TaxID=1179818 RepID=A0ABV9DVU8_9ACTN
MTPKGARVLVVHGAWRTSPAGGELLLWAEDSTAPARTAARARPRPHPYAAPEALLRDTLAAAPGGTGADHGARLAKTRATALDLLLPGSPTHPLPSPALGPVPDAPDVPAPALLPWRVPALAVPAEHAPALLAALRAAPAGDTATGPGLRHLAAVLDFAEHLASTGRLLPRLVGHPPRALWRPVLTGADAAQAAELAAALPPVARAHTDPDRDPPQALAAHALNDLLDAVARARPAPTRGLAPLAAALTASDPLLAPDAADTAAPLAARLRAWHHDAERAPSRARLLFRLIEPQRSPGPDPQAPPGTGSGAAAETWRVEFWVQSSTDPSLQLPLADLWLGHGGAWLPDDVESAMLADLNRAARHYPAVRGALRELAPSGITMGTGGAHVFIRDTAPRLDAAGFAVVLPEWSGRPSLGLRLTARERPAAAGGGISPGDLVDFSLDAVLGDTPVDLGELTELARLKQPLVRLRGHWVEVDPAHLRSALEFLRRRGRGAMRRDEALRMIVDPGPGALPVTAIDADGPLGALLNGDTERRVAPMATPRDFTGALRPYQERGAAWLRFLGGLGLGAILADDMGLGKTVQLLALLTDERGAGPSPGPTLMVCPVSLVGNWQRETARFAPDLRVHVHHGPQRPRGNDLARIAGASDLLITTYGVVLRDSAELAALPWHRVVCDEAQAVKNSGTRQARAVRELPAASRIALTGTPVENNLGELWSIMEFANPGLLGSQAAFRAAIADRVERSVHGRTGGAEPPPGAAGASGAAGDGDGDGDGTALLKRLTGPFILRRLKTDRSIITDLPEKHEIRTWCTLTPEQATLYKAAVDDMTERIDDADGIQRKGLVLATMARLKQICNHPAQFLADGSPLAGRSGKLDRVEGLLEEAMAEGDKALCFTQYTALGDRLAPYLAARLDREVLWLHGGTPRARREEMVRRFQESAEPAVFLLSLKAAGTGLNLTAANHVVHFDRWWNPAVEDQATDRAFRIGQRRDVQVRKLICVGTLEERVDDMIQRKKALAESVVGTGEDWLTELSTEDLRDVIRLAPEAVTR